MEIPPMSFADRYTEDGTLTIGRETLPVLVRISERFDVARGRSTEPIANGTRRAPIQIEEGRRVSGGRLWTTGVSPFIGWRLMASREPVGMLALTDGTTFGVWLRDWHGYNDTFIADFVDARHLHREVKTDED
jgi:hypothetical protein